MTRYYVRKFHVEDILEKKLVGYLRVKKQSAFTMKKTR